MMPQLIEAVMKKIYLKNYRASLLESRKQEEKINFCAASILYEKNFTFIFQNKHSKFQYKALIM